MEGSELWMPEPAAGELPSWLLECQYQILLSKPSCIHERVHLNRFSNPTVFCENCVPTQLNPLDKNTISNSSHCSWSLLVIMSQLSLFNHHAQLQSQVVGSECRNAHVALFAPKTATVIKSNVNHSLPQLTSYLTLLPMSHPRSHYGSWT